MDGIDVAPSNYSLKEGSTLLTFKTSYLDSLSVGEHTVILYYTDDRNVETKLTVFKDTAEENGELGEGNETGGAGESDQSNESVDENVTYNKVNTTKMPDTSDRSNFALWIILLVTSLSVLGGIFYKKRIR